ncbi:hypothetical protein CDAR_241141 [Caerostris darwini]|uniref:Uncharacterized protein n=1 Tax=Caerostris darwini TaxID=1538125 RepID=A0AAV4TF22_9ARAC|nr:hypothetical protein CDAR_241141 [Caerostris darwini]
MKLHFAYPAQFGEDAESIQTACPPFGDGGIRCEDNTGSPLYCQGIHLRLDQQKKAPPLLTVVMTRY